MWGMRSVCAEIVEWDNKVAAGCRLEKRLCLTLQHDFKYTNEKGSCFEERNENTVEDVFLHATKWSDIQQGSKNFAINVFYNL